ncbi:Os03g0770750 [Oryza sativa Japonica Group]|uniref:Os03g0770750 protein n=1 Tax=Oryza sativa subsp. japonica TaxID=39947 RepID=A0A0P0W3I7_ORYSJ|nr:hypothetical protein EE612_020702 [Oryza sativa]BAS86589.1 Os03g0770750 [Oryza sativa Japonica Group]
MDLRCTGCFCPARSAPPRFLLTASMAMYGSPAAAACTVTQLDWDPAELMDRVRGCRWPPVGMMGPAAQTSSAAALAMS